MNTYRSVLVCVTQQKSCERLIKAGAELVKEDGNLFVIHVSKDNWNFVDNATDGEALEYLFSLARSFGADLTILNSDKIPETIAQFAQHYEIELIVTGESPKGKGNSFIKRLQKLLNNTNTELLVIPNACN
ncbi:MAG: universal stress protein UspA [Clostridiaceae bacterium]|nr:universal stress protein UspA [Clostridiaceae bacterium]